MEHLHFEHKNHIGVITLSRPEALNALNYEMLCQLSALLEDIHAQQDVRVVVIRGEGKAFCVGADLKERLKLSQDEVRRNVHKIRSVFEQLELLPQPTIAALHGYAFGGGLELALACDFRYAHQEVQLGLTEVSLGIIPGAGGTIRLTQLIGKAKAKELILMAKRIDGTKAHDLGLIHDLTTEDAFELAMDQAKLIAGLAPLAVVQAKYAINKGYDMDTRTGMDVEGKAYELLIPTEDRVEALQAFNEKRKPVFKGR